MPSASSSISTCRVSRSRGARRAAPAGSPSSSRASIADATTSGSGRAREPAEELHAPGLRHLGEQVRELGERRAVCREPLERALDAEGDPL